MQLLKPFGEVGLLSVSLVGNYMTGIYCITCLLSCSLRGRGDQLGFNLGAVRQLMSCAHPEDKAPV